MHHLNLDQAANVLVKLGHQKVHIEAVVELPAFPNHRISEDVAQFHCVDVEAF